MKDSLSAVSPISVEFDAESGITTASEGDTLIIGWKLSGTITGDVVVTASSDGNYRVDVISDSPTSGVLRVICPNPYSDGFVNFMVNDGRGLTSVRLIRFVERVLDFQEGLEYRVGCEERDLSISLNTNFEYSVKISGEDISWLSIPQSKSGEIASWSETLSIKIAANSSLMPREALISFIPENGSGKAYKEIKIIQNPISTASFSVGDVNFEMVYVEGGTFRMDDDFYGEGHYQYVNLSGYYIGKTEVTQELWEAVMSRNRSRFKGKTLPVEQLNWQDCMDFVLKLSEKTGVDFSLPTEAQWEFAAKGGLKSQGFTYSGSEDADAVSWNKNNSGGKTHPVAEKAPNELGLYDMSGNVSEWCFDWFGFLFPNVTYIGDDMLESEGAILQDHIAKRGQIDWPELPEKEWDRCLRGGSYGQKPNAVTHRDRFFPLSRYDRNGMRLALPVSGPLPR